MNKMDDRGNIFRFKDGEQVPPEMTRLTEHEARILHNYPHSQRKLVLKRLREQKANEAKRKMIANQRRSIGA